ncbi:Hypothetical predicted protein [Lecanosticta acicola]|uniref:Uncharacterized protein n=1 Tax=Lecanosticta acicola TaxID=111012 RepID=A0AAI8Z443_9PEZI|nr:Hypothetical predicted protein [Lecanosticta acicola]
MADLPPAYEEVQRGTESKPDWSGDSKTPQRINIRNEVGASRSQHVAALVVNLVPQVRWRAKSGLSKMTFLLMPSDQVETSKRGQLVGISENDQPVLFHLEGRHDGSDFWTQQEPIMELRDQMLAELVGDEPQLAEQPLPERPVSPPAARSFWSRRQAKAPVVRPQPTKAPISVEVQIEQVHFRMENKYGLYETSRARAVMMVVDVT